MTYLEKAQKRAENKRLKIHATHDKIKSLTPLTKKDTMLKELRASLAMYVTYGDGDLGIPVLRTDAIKDIASMEEHQIGDGTWYACDENGYIKE